MKKDHTDFAEKFFKEWETYKNQYSPQQLFLSSDEKMIEKREQLDNYILEVYERLDERNPMYAAIKDNMTTYLRSLYKNFLKNPNALLYSPLLKNAKIVYKFCPTFQKKDSTGKLIRYRAKDEVEKKYTETVERLMDDLVKDIGTDDPKRKEVQYENFKKLIRQNSDVKDLNPKQIEFIAKYVSNSMLKSNLKNLGYRGDEIKTSVCIFKGKESLGGFQSGDEIHINQNSILTKDIPHLMHVICHETQHVIQNYESKHNSNSKIGLDYAVCDIINNYFITKENYDVYHTNYRVEEIEKDAERQGDRNARIMLDSMGFSEEANKLKEEEKNKTRNRQFEYDYRRYSDRKRATREQFIFDTLNKSISEKPNLMEIYPALSNLYNKDGSVKSFEDIISNDFSLTEYSKSEILEDFCKYYINKGELKNLDLSKFPEETQGKIASRLINILISEHIQIGEMNRGVQNISEATRSGCEIFHLKNSRNIMKFINNNYEHLRELQDNGKFSSIINMDSYDYNAILPFKNDKLYERLAYIKKNPIAKEDLISLSLEAEKKEKEYKSKKKQKFTEHNLESSFDALTNDTRISQFNGATQEMRNLEGIQKVQEEKEMEEK